jgi:hypothetical protein
MNSSISLGDRYLLDSETSYFDTLVVVDTIYLKDNIKHIRFNGNLRLYYGKSIKPTFVECIGLNNFFLGLKFIGNRVYKISFM